MKVNKEENSIEMPILTKANSEHFTEENIKRLYNTLNHMHEANVFHNDILPDNIMVANSGELVLISPKKDMRTNNMIYLGCETEEDFKKADNTALAIAICLKKC